MNKADIHTRFHKLAVKEALGTITPEEKAKLERYSALVYPFRRDDPEWKSLRILGYNAAKLRKLIGAQQYAEAQEKRATGQPRSDTAPSTP